MSWHLESGQVIGFRFCLLPPNLFFCYMSSDCMWFCFSVLMPHTSVEMLLNMDVKAGRWVLCRQETCQQLSDSGYLDGYSASKRMTLICSWLSPLAQIYTVWNLVKCFAFHLNMWQNKALAAACNWCHLSNVGWTTNYIESIVKLAQTQLPLGFKMKEYVSQ